MLQSNSRKWASKLFENVLTREFPFPLIEKVSVKPKIVINGDQLLQD